MDFFAVNEKGETLLHVVAGNVTTFWRHQVPRFRFLMEKGLDPVAEDGSQRTPLDVAAGVGANDILELFRRK